MSDHGGFQDCQTWGRILLGGVAGSSIGRVALKGDAFRTGYGYGIYFTDNRIIGLSHKRMLARSYYPAYLISLAFMTLLTSVVAFAVLTWIPPDRPVPLP